MLTSRLLPFSPRNNSTEDQSLVPTTSSSDLRKSERSHGFLSKFRRFLVVLKGKHSHNKEPPLPDQIHVVNDPVLPDLPIAVEVTKEIVRDQELNPRGDDGLRESHSEDSSISLDDASNIAMPSQSNDELYDNASDVAEPSKSDDELNDNASISPGSSNHHDNCDTYSMHSSHSASGLSATWTTHHCNEHINEDQDTAEGDDPDDLEASLSSLPDLRVEAVVDSPGSDDGPNVPLLPPGLFFPTFASLQADNALCEGRLRPPTPFDPNAPSPKDPIIPRELALQGSPYRNPGASLDPHPVIPSLYGRHNLVPSLAVTAADSNIQDPIIWNQTPLQGSPYARRRGHAHLEPQPVIPTSYRGYNLAPSPGISAVDLNAPSPKDPIIPRQLPIKDSPYCGNIQLDQSPVIPTPYRGHNLAPPSPITPTGQRGFRAYPSPVSPIDKSLYRTPRATPALDHQALTPAQQSTLATPAGQAWTNLPQVPSCQTCTTMEMDADRYIAPSEAEPSDILIHKDICYSLFYEIGRGSFGRVIYAKVNGKARGVVAIKVLNKIDLTLQRYAGNGNSGLCAGDIKKEFQIMRLASQSDSKFLAPLLASFQDLKNIYFVLPLYPSNLEDRLRKLEQLHLPMRMEEIVLDGAQILLGLEALHQLNIYHCDLKPENILIASSGNLVIADFGLAVNQHRSQLCKGPFGTAHYSAREVWSKFQPAYADIWSYGAILLQMMLGTPEPFFGSDPDARPRFVTFRQFITNTAAASLLSSILNSGPKYRPEISYIKNDAFFAGLNWRKVADREYIPIHRPEPAMPSAATHGLEPYVDLSQAQIAQIDYQLKEIDELVVDSQLPAEKIKQYMKE